MNKNLVFIVFALLSFGVICAEMNDPEDNQAAISYEQWETVISMISQGYKTFYSKLLSLQSSLHLAKTYFIGEEEGGKLESLAAQEAYKILRERTKKNRQYLEANKTLGPHQEDKFFFLERFDADLTDISLQGAYLWDCKYGKITFTNVVFDNGWIINTTFDMCTFNNVSFKGLTAVNLGFNKSTLKNCDFSDAKLPMLDVRESSVENATFARADLPDAYFSNDINTIDLTEANICGLNLGNNLKTNKRFIIDGAIVDFVNAFNPEIGINEDFPAIDFFDWIGIKYDPNNPPSIIRSSTLGRKRTLDDQQEPNCKRKKE